MIGRVLKDNLMRPAQTGFERFGALRRIGNTVDIVVTVLSHQKNQLSWRVRCKLIGMMSGSTSGKGPRGFVLEHFYQLEMLWGGVRDADVDSIHKARVATRRIRAALPVMFNAGADDAAAFRRIGRQLGRVRELDVTLELLGSLQSLAPAAASAVAILRRDVERDRGSGVRRMIKGLDDVDLPRLRHRLSTAGVTGLKSLWRDWGRELRVQIAVRATETTKAIDHASGVYMPNRVHRVRVAVKKLRYALEVASSTRVVARPQILSDLKKAQETLGRIHDLQIVARTLEQDELASSAPREERRVLESVLEAERARLFSRYLARRATLVADCGMCRELAPNSVALARLGTITTRSLPAAALVAVPAVLWYAGKETTGSSR